MGDIRTPLPAGRVESSTRLRLLLAALAAVILLPGCAQVTTPAAPKNDGSLTLQLGARPPLRVDADTLRAHAPEKLAVDWQREGNVEKATFTGVRLTSLLALLNVPSGRDLRGDWLSAVVTAVGADGYQVSFGIADLEPSSSGRRAVVAWERDGQPLASGEAPLRLVIGGDQRPSRSVRQLVALRVSEPRPRTAAATSQ
jgi:hypothetical protein